MGRAYGTPLKLDNIEACTILVQQQLPMDGDEVGVLFRVEAVSYAAIQPYADEYSGDGEWYSTDPRLEVFALPVRRWTEHGATLVEFSGARPRWVDLREGHKQYASRTIEQAIESFAARRLAQIRILSKQLARAHRELDLTKPRDELGFSN